MRNVGELERAGQISDRRDSPGGNARGENLDRFTGFAAEIDRLTVLRPKGRVGVQFERCAQFARRTAIRGDNVKIGLSHPARARGTEIRDPFAIGRPASGVIRRISRNQPAFLLGRDIEHPDCGQVAIIGTRRGI